MACEANGAEVMGRPLADNPARDLDFLILNTAIAAARNDGHNIPCLAPDALNDGWTAGDDDPHADALAALQCAGCDVINECRKYGLRYPDEVGTYGGLSHAQRRPKRGRPSTAA